jgi:hypothetical protein
VYALPDGSSSALAAWLKAMAYQLMLGLRLNRVCVLQGNIAWDRKNNKIVGLCDDYDRVLQQGSKAGKVRRLNCKWCVC